MHAVSHSLLRLANGGERSMGNAEQRCAMHGCEKLMQAGGNFFFVAIREMEYNEFAI